MHLTNTLNIMKKSVITILELLFVSLLIVSCEKDDVDNTPPVINLVQPVTESEYHLGDTVPFECDFSDDVELNAYKVEIHYGEDHDHKSVVLDHDSEEGEEWTYTHNANFDLGETNVTVTLTDIVVPDSIEHNGVMEPILEGEYHIGVYCTDVAGNQSEYFTTIDVGDHDH